MRFSYEYTATYDNGKKRSHAGETDVVTDNLVKAMSDLSKRIGQTTLISGAASFEMKISFAD